jgi:pSer/pThr/pTyr-binding forkhead associated (FHA) protein
VILLVAGNHCRVGRADPRESLAPELDLAPLEAGRPRPSVSRRHAEIARLPEGWQVTDLGSANGTELDGRRLRPGRPEPLSPGSRVCFGALCFVVEEEP